MGMYTDIEFKVKLKAEFIPVIQAMNDRLIGDMNPWAKTPWTEYANWDRSNFIPFGGCMNHRNELVDGVWTVHCSLKNYEGTIAAFNRIVATEAFEEIYEYTTTTESSTDWDESHRTYALVDGEIVETIHPCSAITIKETWWGASEDDLQDQD